MKLSSSFTASFAGPSAALRVALLLFPAAIAGAQQTTPPAPPAATPPASTSGTSGDLPDMPAAQVHTSPQPTGATAVIDTAMGRITCRFFDKQAPETVANFIGLASGTKDWKDPDSGKMMHHKPLYDGTQFHRVIPEFMIQGGDPTATGMGDPGYFVKNEQDPDLNFDVAGRLAMANSGPDTNGSQFFVTEQAVAELDQKYTIFGQCDDPSVLVVKTIARVERDSHDKPLTPVLLNKVTIVAAGQPLPAAPQTAAPQAAPSSAPSPATAPPANAAQPH